MRQKLAAEHPELIGALDGIPSLERDTLNRRLLAQKIGRLTADGSNPQLLRTLINLRNKLSEGGSPLINAQDGNAPMTGPDDARIVSPPMFLLGFAADGNGRAIVAAGDPDTADTVVAYAPGMGTYLSDHFVSKDILHAQNLTVSAGQADPSHTTSTIVWLGYDAPPALVGGDSGWLDRGTSWTAPTLRRAPRPASAS